MPIFQEQNGLLRKLDVRSLDLERTLQKLVERNLEQVFGAWFLASEFSTTSGGRIDTLAVDANGAPVIIEYKRNRNDNVINQALSYLRWLRLQQPGFFQNLMQQRLTPEILDQITLDWNNPRVICMAESFSKFDIDTVEVVPLRIELYRFRFHDGSLLAIDGININDADKPVAQSPVDRQTEDRHESTAEDYLKVLIEGTSAQTRALFMAFRERVMALDGLVREKPTRLYVGYRLTRNFAEVHLQGGGLKIHIRPLKYNDPRGLVDQIPPGYNWTLDRRIRLSSLDDLDYVMSIIEQSYQDVL